METADSDVAKRPVLLLKASKGDESTDPYVEILTQAGFAPTVIPVLSFTFVNRDELVLLLQRLEEFSAIIFTSTRAVQAVQLALCSLDKDVWQQKLEMATCFVVGESTGAAARELGFSPLGEEAGSASHLAEIILQSLSKESKPVLFPCSEIRKDTLPNNLREKGILVKEVVAYSTCPHENLRDHLTEALSNQPEFVVFFSPSGVRYAASCDMSNALNESKMIAMGKTTEKELTAHGFHVHCTTAAPNPESLMNLLKLS